MSIGVWPKENRITCLDTSTIENAIDDRPHVWDRPDISDRVLQRRISVACLYVCQGMLPQVADQL
jgi:hypothetical protein